MLARIEYSRDLHASNALYHQSCSVKYRKGRDILDVNLSEPLTKKRRGRYLNSEKEITIAKVLQYLEANDEEHISVTNLIEKMKEYLGDKENAFSSPHMKARLKDPCGENLLFAEINGKPNVVTFRGTASNILRDFSSLR